MPRTFTFTECYDLLQVDPKTFRNWLKKAGIDPEKQKSKLDERVRYLDEFQVKKLALDHGRDPELKRAVAPEGSNQQGTGQGVSISTHKLLDERVRDLEAKQLDPAAVTGNMTEIESRLADLEHKYATTLQQLTDALIIIQDLADWKAAQESKPKAGRKPRASTIAGTPEYQAGLAAVEGDD
jgi:hypothetical protein